MNGRRLLIGVAVLLALAGLGIAGYALGRADTASKAEASEAQRRAFNISFSAGKDQGRRAGVARGIAKGKREGRAAGRRAGARRGLAAGQTAAGQRRQQQAEAVEQQRQQQIDSNRKERESNCNAPLFADGYCPTDEEVQQEDDAESLCGPGTAEGREKAAQKGVDC